MVQIKQKKVVVAMSGGVDSSVAALLLQKQGYQVIGMFMRLFAGQQENESAARRICQKFKIKFYPINYASQFKKEVIDYFLNSYNQGITPNPCIKCNQLIKFGVLLKQANKIGADYLATGHYTRLRREFPISLPCRPAGNFQFPIKLFKGKDKDKDQSYFLYTLNQKQLAQILFPLGEYTKNQVRKIADKAKLPYLQQESQDVCFLTGEHNDFLKQHLDLKSGAIIALPPSLPPAHPSREGGIREKCIKRVLSPAKHERGRVRVGKKIGEHQGLPLYTIGQRKGVEIGGIGPFYVVKADYKTNTLYVTKNRDDKALYKNELIAKNVNWLSGKEPKLPLQCEAVIRYRHQPVKCTITLPPTHLLPESFDGVKIRRGEKGERYKVKLINHNELLLLDRVWYSTCLAESRRVEVMKF